MNNVLVKQEFNEAVEEIQAIFVEAEFASRWVLIEAHHKVGQIILSLPGTVAENVHALAEQTDRGERLLYYSVKFAQTYKTVNDLPEGKNVTWNKVIREHLTTSKEASEHVHSVIQICSSCKRRLD